MNYGVQNEVQFRSRFSFKPLLRMWENAITDGKPGIGEIYADLLNKVKEYPDLLEAITDESLLEKHAPLIAQMMTTVFPVTLSDKDDLYAISLPFQYKVIYSSSLFRQLFMDAPGKIILMPDDATSERMYEEKCLGAYQIILSRLYDIKIDGTVTSVHPYKCPDSGLDRFMELELDTRFIDVVTKKPLPELPASMINKCCRISDLAGMKELQELFNLEDYYFEGMVIVRIREVTEREIINKIKNELLHIHSFADHDVFKELQVQIRNLLGVDGVHTAIKPFFKVNNHLVLSQLITSDTYVKNHKDVPQSTKIELHKQIVSFFKTRTHILRVDDLTEETLYRYPFLFMLHERGFKNALVCPLFTEDKELLGLLILASLQAGMLSREHAARIEPALPLFTIALQKSQEQLDHQVDKVIKEQFTAVQDAVEWRFTDAALNYLQKDKGPQTKIESIVFEDVFPLYGAIDIRNSSVERNNAIQLDMLEQLAMAYRIVERAKAAGAYPLLDEIQFRIQRYTHSVTNILFAEEEMAIHHFLAEELAGLFRHLRQVMPLLEREVGEYLEAIDSPVRMIYHHRKGYEESITKINNEVAMLIDHEQKAAQEIFPHYFERFVTDGLDFNIYIGQSISPNIPFDTFYLRNLKIWQLHTLVKAAQLTHKLQDELPLRLHTTQLILAHSHPISISFRTAERKFDVDGAYNIRYEIIKKRIDKVHIRDTHERLTKPGTIAIVYSQPKEAEEYAGYIEFLQSKGLLKDDLERYDLEELQGVVGLRGLRVSVNTDLPDTPEAAKEPAVENSPIKEVSRILHP
ncbi:MAG: hypothetical protein WCF67_25050 [Chitinophagaceae bacterium]